MNGHMVLVVEDNPITRKMMRIALESDGYEVLEAGDGRSALAAAAERVPDLIILDYVLPDTDGMRLLEELRRQAGREDLPVLLVTGMVSRLGELRARAGEHTQFLAKPIEPSRLLELVRAHLCAPTASGEGRTVLVADDDPLNLKLAALRLGHEGYAVEHQRRGRRGPWRRPAPRRRTPSSPMPACRRWTASPSAARCAATPRWRRCR